MKKVYIISIIMILVLISTSLALAEDNYNSCDDGNPCTIDTFTNNSCAYEFVEAGTACGDGMICNQDAVCIPDARPRVLGDKKGHAMMKYPVEKNEGNNLCQELLLNNDIKGTELPGFVPFKNEIVQIYQLPNISIGHVTLKDGVVTNVNCTNDNDATLEIYYKNIASVEKIANAKDPAKVYQEEIANGDLVIKAKTFSNKVKKSIVNLALRVWGWFK